MTDRDKRANITVNLGLGFNIMLSLLKTSIGILGRSSALLADGINSSSDVIYYIVVKIFMHHAKKPADSEHPYGHRQLETISAIVVGAFILTTGIAIFWEAINKVYELIKDHSLGHSASVWALYIALGTVILKIFLYLYTRSNYRITKNPTLKALANDHMNDIMAAIAVSIGVLMGRLGYYWMDPAAGAVVAIYILKTGIEIIMDNASELMDSFPDEDFKSEVRKIAMDVEGVMKVDDLGVHKFGPYFIVNMIIAVDGQIAVNKGHEISDEVERRLMTQFDQDLRKVHIHYHPYDSKKRT